MAASARRFHHTSRTHISTLNRNEHERLLDDAHGLWERIVTRDHRDIAGCRQLHSCLGQFLSLPEAVLQEFFSRSER